VQFRRYPLSQLSRLAAVLRRLGDLSQSPRLGGRWLPSWSVSWSIRTGIAVATQNVNHQENDRIGLNVTLCLQLQNYDTLIVIAIHLHPEYHTYASPLIKFELEIFNPVDPFDAE
jgi:hypothetical protein